MGDDPGLGKTRQALIWLKLHNELRTIVVCPATVKWKWKEEEADVYAPYLKTIVLSGQTPTRISFKYNLVIINYDILKYWEKRLKEWGANAIIADESHRLRNRDTQKFKAFTRIAKSCKHLICLTGTPVLNSPMDYYNVLKMLRPKAFSSFRYFAHRYCDAKFNGFGWDFRGSSNEAELHKLLTKDLGIMKRRLQKEVLPELPPVTPHPIPLHITSKEMKESEEAVQAAKESGDKIIGFAAREQARQACLMAKLPYVVEWIKDFLENKDEKLTVFGWHKIGLHTLKDKFPKNSVLVDGDVTGKKRHNEILKFRKNKDYPLLFGNLQSIGEGIDLIECHHTLIIEFPWGPEELKQMIGRFNRMGQKHPVHVWYMFVVDSIDTKMIDMNDLKKTIISRVVDGVDVDKKALLSALLEKGEE